MVSRHVRPDVAVGDAAAGCQHHGAARTCPRARDKAAERQITAQRLVADVYGRGDHGIGTVRAVHHRDAGARLHVHRACTARGDVTRRALRQRRLGDHRHVSRPAGQRRVQRQVASGRLQAHVAAAVGRDNVAHGQYAPGHQHDRAVAAARGHQTRLRRSVRGVGTRQRTSGRDALQRHGRHRAHSQCRGLGQADAAAASACRQRRSLGLQRVGRGRPQQANAARGRQAQGAGIDVDRRVAGVVQDRATRADHADRAPAGLTGQQAIRAVGRRARIQHTHRDAATRIDRRTRTVHRARHHPDVAARSLEHRARIHLDRAACPRGLHVDRARRRRHVARSRIGLRATRQDAHAAAARIHRRVQRQGSAHRLQQHVTRARSRHRGIDRQRASRAGAVAQHQGTVGAGGQASQGSRVCQSRDGAVCADTLDRDGRDAAHRQAVVLGDEQPGVGTRGRRGQVRDARLDGVCARTDTRASRHAQALRGDVDRVGAGRHRVGDGRARHEGDAALVGRAGGAGVQHAQSDAGGGLHAHGAVVRHEAGISPHRDRAAAGLHVNGAAIGLRRQLDRGLRRAQVDRPTGQHADVARG